MADQGLDLGLIRQGVETVVRELAEAGGLKEGRLLVLGVSTSEIYGERIGTGGAMEAAHAVYEGVHAAQAAGGFAVAYQCCEHLNRALVVERSWLEREPWLTEVSVVPVPKAGGSMAAYAFESMEDPCMVESIRAHAGIDIGDTLIGMHLRQVAVPFRPSLRRIGQAHVNAAYTRPKLIGGARAQYTRDTRNQGTNCQ